MSKVITVSVIVPIYGVEKYIKQCVQSLICQTYKQCEFIFVDDCSPDSSMSILVSELKKSQLNYRIITHSVNRGLAAARISGLSIATGDFVIHVDSDDALDLEAIELLVNSAVANNSDIVVSDRLLLTTKKRYVNKLVFDYNTEVYLEKVLLRRANYSITGKLFRRKLVALDFFKEGINFGEDYLAFSKILSWSECLSYIDKPLYLYNQTNLSSYTKTMNLNSIKQLCLAQKEIISFFEEKGTVSNIILLNSSSQVIVHLIKTSFHSREYLQYIYSELYSEYLLSSQLSFMDKIFFHLFKYRFFSIIKGILSVGYYFKNKI